MSQRRSLTDFASFEKPKQTEPEQPQQPSFNIVKKTEQSDVTVLRNTETEQDSVINTIPVHEDTESLETSIVQKYASRKGKKPARQTIEDTHTRQTYLIRNDLIARLERLAKGQRRGFKTEFVNDALELLLAKAESAKE